MASIATTPGRQVRARSREVVGYHYDDARPGKPLHLLIPGGLLAVGAFLAICFVLYAAIVDESLPGSQAGWLVIPLLLPYFGGLLLFSYGYELYDWPRAVRLATISGLIGLGAILVIFTIAYIWRILYLAGGAGAAGAGGKGSSDSSSASTSSSRSSDSLISLDLRGANFPFSGGRTSAPSSKSAARCSICGLRLEGLGSAHQCPGPSPPITSSRKGKSASLRPPTPPVCPSCGRPWADPAITTCRYCPYQVPWSTRSDEPAH